MADMSKELAVSPQYVSKVVSQLVERGVVKKKGRKPPKQLTYEQFLDERVKDRERNYVLRHREKILKILGYECAKCLSVPVQIHHWRYKDLKWDDIEAYCRGLSVFCVPCHNEVHKGL